MGSSRGKAITCTIVVEELRSRLPEGIARQTLDFGLHYADFLPREGEP